MQTAGMGGGGRKRKAGPTQQGQRMHWLMLELVEQFGSQAEVARKTGLDPQYVNAFRNLETSGVKGVSADILGVLLSRVGLDPMFFFDKWSDGERRSYKLYSLADRRNTNKVNSLEDRVAGLEDDLAEMKALMRQMAGKPATDAAAAPRVAKKPRTLT